jgi:hypothetical protein
MADVLAPESPEVAALALLAGLDDPVAAARSAPAARYFERAALVAAELATLVAQIGAGLASEVGPVARLARVGEAVPAPGICDAQRAIAPRVEKAEERQAAEGKHISETN